MPKIIFTGGGTAGHILPIIAIIREIQKEYQDSNLEGHQGNDLKLFYFGPKDEYASYLLVKENVVIKNIYSGKIRRYFSFKNFIDLLKIPIGFIQSFFWLFFSNIDIVFSKGGYGSFPTVLAAELLGIPIFLHESDSVPGLSSKIEGKWALEIFTSFYKTEKFDKQKMICVGNPIRQEIINGDENTAKKIFQLQGGKPVVLVIGGSQGSQKINNIILEVLPELLENFEIIHQTGKRNYTMVKNEAQVLLNKNLAKYYHPIAFLDEEEMKHSFKASRLIVSRAGAGAIFEIAAVRKPAILIPLKGSAQNHQEENAYRFQKQGGAEVIEEDNLTPHFFLERLKYFFTREDILRKMGNASGNFAKPKSAKIIASYIIEYTK